MSPYGLMGFAVECSFICGLFPQTAQDEAKIIHLTLVSRHDFVRFRVPFTFTSSVRVGSLIDYVTLTIAAS
jgi:hypothetical protein